MKKPWNPFEIFKFEFDDDHLVSCSIPKGVEVCVCCESRLYAQVDGWESEIDANLWFPTSIDLECKRGMKCYLEYENSDYWRMPYVYWLPVDG